MEESFSPSPLLSQKEINQDWLEKVLSHSQKGAVKVQSWTVKSPDRRNGFLSEICFVKVSYTASEGCTEERDLVIKFNPQDKKLVEIMMNGNLGKREVAFYKYAGSEDVRAFFFKCGLINPVPYVYLAGIKESLLTIVMHDLNTDGYKLSTPAEGNYLNQIKSTLKPLAIIHASGIAAIQSHGKLYVDFSWDPSFLDELVKTGIDLQVKLYDGTTTANTLKSLIPHSADLVNWSDKYPFVDTLIHGDLWTGNVMFSDDDQLASIFDWQFAKVGNPVCDILTLLLMSSHPSVYNEHLIETLEFYWDNFERALKQNGVSSGISFEDLVRNLEDMWMYGFMFMSASLSVLVENSKITVGRVQAIVSFLEEKEAFAKFLLSCR
ncbi:uncharacterized protein LOC121854804 isoform X3 [Homarus americanus]|uniref:uncharacterized protein LOC121854804 isoform X3 n=1 Tax=Homarus americanus TaxID=6706 RepID=UPI001C4629F5|nr:uncharacterized protein LOC121854804 isoform X3 [Homarus americanus]